uniref:Fas apoptotic inhibitory molecule b n=1 Tax=Neogobius melanostomus TaxID=47308 RepID=A0A8C6UDG5_9GOBI
MCRQVCALWEVPLSDGVYTIEFEHGTTTGKRVIHVNGQEILRRDWMFKLVGRESFYFGEARTKAVICIEAVGGFSYEYSLHVNGLSLQKFTQNRARTTRTWQLRLDERDHRVVLEKDSMDVWCNGQKMDTTGQFVEDGTETVFFIGEHEVCIKAFSEQKKRGVQHCLLLDGLRVQTS